MSLTPREQSILAFIEDYRAENPYAPTLSEIAQHLNLKSRGVMHRYVKQLAKKGYLTLSQQKKRNIELVKPESFSLPLVGKIAAGHPIEAICDEESVHLLDLLMGQGRYALKVAGDSMIDEGIHDGDIVICQQSSYAKGGQIVVALVDRDQATLKRIKYHEDGDVSLIPANASYQPLKLASQRVSIQGIFIGLLRLML